MIVSTLGLLDLILSIMVLLLVAVATYVQRVRYKVRTHAVMMAVAWALNLSLIVLIMLPAFDTISSVGFGVDWRFEALLVHHLLGLVALASSTLLVGSWLVRGRRPNSCIGAPQNKRLIMRVTLVSWVLALVLGILIYILFI